MPQACYCFFGGIAIRQSDGTHLSAITQKSRQGGMPVYSASISKWRPVGNRFPDSHKLTVPIETPKSEAIVLSWTLFLSRQLWNAVAKLARMSQRDFVPLATLRYYPKFACRGKQTYLPSHRKRHRGFL
jgi:hypothetical protein